MKEDQDIAHLDNIIDNFIMGHVSGFDMITFFKMAIAERAIEIAGNKAKAADLLKIKRASLYRWFQRKNEKTNL